MVCTDSCDFVAQEGAERPGRRPQVRSTASPWCMSMPAIANLVRSLTQPYVGAHYEMSGADGTVWRVEVVAGDVHSACVNVAAEAFVLFKEFR